MQVDFLQLVLQSTAPALEAHIDIVLLSKVAGETAMISVRTRDGEAGLADMRWVEGDRQPVC